MLAFMLPLGVIGPTQILVIVILIIVLFGGKKIPELMRGMGRGVKEFKDAVNKDYTAENTNETTAPTAPQVPGTKLPKTTPPNKPRG